MGDDVAAGESAKAKEAFADYLSLGGERTLRALSERYQTANKNRQPVPTVRLKTLADWSVQFAWQDRLKAIGDEQASRLADAETDEKIRVMRQGFALKEERVKALNRLAGKLLSELEGDRLWVSEPKMIGTGLLSREVEIERFNTAELEQFRGLLDDITKETGERVKLEKHEMVGELPVQRVIILDSDAGPPPGMAAAGGGKLALPGAAD